MDAFRDGNYHPVVLVWDGERATLFVDGEQVEMCECR